MDFSYDDNDLTLELIEKLRANAEKLSKELNEMGALEFSETGKLTSAELNEKANEYELLTMTIHKLEDILLKNV